MGALARAETTPQVSSVDLRDSNHKFRLPSMELHHHQNNNLDEETDFLAAHLLDRLLFEENEDILNQICPKNLLYEFHLAEMDARKAPRIPKSRSQSVAYRNSVTKARGYVSK